MNQLPRPDLSDRIELNAWMRSPGLQRADYRPEAVSPDETTPDAAPRAKVRVDRATVFVAIAIVVVIVLVVVWVLHTGGFGTPPVPTPSV